MATTTRRPGPRARCAALVACALLAVACARRDQPTVEQQDDADAQRRLYLGLARPLISGDERLLADLAPAASATSAFALDAAGATALAHPAGAEDACREDVALFLSAPHGAGAAGTWLLDPRRMRLEAVPEGRCAVFRAIAAGGGAAGPLEIVRYDFTVTAGLVTPDGRQRLTSDGGNSAPVAIAAGHAVAWLHRDGAHARLLAVDAAGGAPRALLPALDADVQDLSAEAGGLTFAADPDGPWRMYHCAQDGSGLAPWAGPDPAAAAAGAAPVATVAFALADGRLRPQLLEIPARLDLRAVAALVAARNPAVLRRRALLAAALIEASQLRLNNLPVIGLGLLYNPVVGVLTDPVGFSGDYLAGGVVRGLIGVTQPLLDWDRNHALSAAGAVRADIARDALAEELNHQQAEAAATLVAWQAARERASQDRALAALAERTAAGVARLAVSGRSGRVEELAAAQERDQRRGELDADERWVRVLRDRLLGQCGLDATCASEPAAALPWEDVAIDDYPALLRVALLNHPRLRAARGALREAFFTAQIGSRYRPGLDASAGYALSLRHGSDPIDDFVTLGLNGSLPLAWFRDRDLDREHHAQLAEALRAGAEEAALAIRRDLADGWASRQQWRATLAAERARGATAAAAQRVAGLRSDQGQPGTGAPITLASLAAGEREVLLAARAATAAWQEVAARTIAIAEAQGLADDLWRRVRLPAATWLWHRDVLADGGEGALNAARAAGIDRIYLYVGPDGADLSGAPGDALAAFTTRAARAGVAVWALLGEPEWLEGGDGLARSVSALGAFQARAGQPFQGLKLDLEPHARPGWAEPAGRARLTARYLELLDTARQAWPGALWVDGPAQLFRSDQDGLLAALVARVDGLTAMCYADTGDGVAQLADQALAAWPKALEIGVDLSPASPRGETLAGWPAGRLEGLRRRLDGAGPGARRLRGVAFHDLAALLALPADPVTPDGAAAPGASGAAIPADPPAATSTPAVPAAPADPSPAAPSREVHP